MRWILATALTAGLVLTSPARAQSCATTIEANDQLQYSLHEMTVDSSCESYSLTLKHTGSLGARVMGHNWVLTASDDYQAVANAGMNATEKNNYVPPNDDRVLAATKIIGGGEETTISFDPSKLEIGGDYTYFCSFPGHYSVMFGKLAVE